MRAKKFFLFAALILYMTNTGHAQVNLPSVVPASPQAAALQKFIDYPVGLYTGTVDITVPIYTIEADGIKVPIELKYHSSGIRYDDCSKGVGVGWTLFAGGMVTHSIIGKPDGEFPMFNKRAMAIQPIMNDVDPQYTDIYAMLNIERGLKDNEYDMFSYSFLNYSGKFFYPGTTSPVFSPRANLKVNFTNSMGSGLAIFPLTMIDEDGVTYIFRDGETPSVNSTLVSSYVLNEIISADKSDTIKFNYTGVSTANYGSSFAYRRMVITSSTTHLDMHRAAGFTPEPADNLGPWGGGYVGFEDFTYQRLDNITFKGGKVVFTYNGTNQLINVRAFNNTDAVPLKSATLYQTVFGSDNSYNKLDSVQFQEQGVNPPRTYSYKFGYNGQPYDRRSGIDYWGYYNGPTAPAGGYTPDFDIQMQEASGSYTIPAGTANRRPDADAMQKGILNKVSYPTGGYSTFTYEAHQSGGNIVGGVRIKSIASYDANNISQGQKWYKYGADESGNGTMYRPVNPEDYCYTQQLEGTKGSIELKYIYRERTYSSFPVFSNLGSGSAVLYPIVTEYTGDGINANGKTVSEFEHFDDQFNYISGSSYTPIPMVYISNSWKTGNLLSKKTYNQSGTVISSITNKYKDLNFQEYFSLKVMRFLDWPELFSYVGTAASGYDILAEWYKTPPLYGIELSAGPMAYQDYRLSSGIRVLDSVVTFNDGVSTMTRYGYDGTYDKPTTVTSRHGDGSFSVTQMTYPFNKSGTVYTGMVTANIINPVIDQEEYKTSTSNFLRSTITDWDNWSGLYYKPKTVSTKTGSADAEVRLRYSSYDRKGNVQTVAKEGGPKTTYIWSYKGTYPVAEIQNADYATVEAALGGTTLVNNFLNSNPTDAEMTSFRAQLIGAPSLQGAMVTTYTYQPMVGVTSTTDAKGLTTYYEYDGFNRLNIVRDKDGNIVKAICYNYKGEPTTNCYVPALRNIYAKVERSNATPGGTMPDYYTYEDLRLKFYADAACTQPMTFTTSTSITVTENRVTFNDIDNSTTNAVTGSLSFTVAANQSSSAPVNRLTHHLHTYDYDGYSFGDTETYTFTINAPTTGNLFVALN